jgi:hypothetical protein
MCGDLFRKWLVLVVCAYGAAAAGQPKEPAAEANESWIAAKHLAPGWESMALTTRLFNPDMPPSVNKTPRRSLSFAGQIHVIDPNGLIGLEEVATHAIVFDEVGNHIQMAGTTSYGSPLYQPIRYVGTLWVPTGEVIVSIWPYSFSIDMLMGYDMPFPVTLSRLEWTMSVLLSDTFITVDIPFAATNDWVELTPGLEVLVEQAAVSEGKYNYRLKARYNPDRILYLYARDTTPLPCEPPESSYDTYTWSGQTPPETIVTAIDVLDPNGNAIWRYSFGSRTIGGSFGFSSDTRNIGSGTISGNATIIGNGKCPDCDRAAFIRHTMALKPYTQDVQFVLENVPVPTE